MELIMFTKQHRVNSISDIPQNSKFIVIYNDQETSMGHDYGPPDPKPTMETYNVVKLLAFIEEEHLKEWIKQNQNKKFTVIKYEPLTIKTELLISLS